jgi:predicted PurR-regulated permease PerM
MDTPKITEFYRWTARDVVIGTLFIVAVTLSFYLLFHFRIVIFVLFIAVVIGTAIRPAVDWLHQRGVSRPTGIITVYFLIFLVIISILFLIFPLLINQATQIWQAIPDYYGNFRTAMLESRSFVLRNLGQGLPVTLAFFPRDPQMDVDPLERVSQFFQLTGMLLRGIFAIFAVFILAFFWTLESEKAIRGLLLFLPKNNRESIRDFLTTLEEKLGGFIRGEILLMLSVGVMSFFAYLIIGIPYPLILAIFAGLMEAIPIFGPALGILPAILITISVDPSRVIWVLVAYLAIQSAENYLLLPRIMKKRVGVNPILTLLALATLTSLIGLPGALLAIPLAAIFQMVINQFIIKPATSEQPPPAGRDRVSVLRYEAQDLAQDIRKKMMLEENPIHQNADGTNEYLEMIASDLDRLLKQLSDDERQQ